MFACITFIPILHHFILHRNLIHSDATKQAEGETAAVKRVIMDGFYNNIH